MLKNIHLAPQWLVQLEKKLHNLSPHQSFRLFMTSEIHPQLPPNLLRQSHIFSYEPPPGVKANLQHTFAALTASRYIINNPFELNMWLITSLEWTSTQWRDLASISYLHGSTPSSKSVLDTFPSDGLRFSSSMMLYALSLSILNLFFINAAYRTNVELWIVLTIGWTCTQREEATFLQRRFHGWLSVLCWAKLSMEVVWITSSI